MSFKTAASTLTKKQQLVAQVGAFQGGSLRIQSYYNGPAVSQASCKLRID